MDNPLKAVSIKNPMSSSAIKRQKNMQAFWDMLFQFHEVQLKDTKFLFDLFLSEVSIP